MSHARVFSTPAGVALGPLEQIADGKARNFVLQIGESYFHGFVVRQGAEVFGYVDRCPHAGLPLAEELDDYLTPQGDLIACQWHGALFTIGSGRCVGGPCAGAYLMPWPVRNENGIIITA
ncbi:MAG: Rieske (2Fe-2S) protein [Asticcacaulis sp.]